MAKDPNCRHVKTVQVTSHEDYKEILNNNDSFASVYSCEREKCLADAKFWVQGSTGKEAKVLPLPAVPSAVGRMKITPNT